MNGYEVWGWGRTSAEAPTPHQLNELAPLVFGATGVPPQAPLPTRELPELPSPRVRLPDSLAASGSDHPSDRARHALGRSYIDLVRGMSGDLPHVPDLVVRPVDEQGVTDLLGWAADHRVAVVPYGGGTSVVGGVTPDVADDWAGVVSLDTAHLAGLLDLDVTSRAARLGAGTLGPSAEMLLREHGLTLRFYPQSFQRSTVGGWLATRAGGHFASGPTHVDDLVEQVRAVTPAGLWDSRRLPASGAGPSPDRLLLGSEGALGVITSAWLRVQPRPAHRWAAVMAAPTFAAGLHAVRALAQAGLRPATCRLVDAAEARLTGTLTTGEAVLVLGLESLHVPVEAEARAVVEIARGHGLRVVEQGDRGAVGDSWRSTFVQAPYLRERLVLLGLVLETFETATTWDKLHDLVTNVCSTVTKALQQVCGGGTVTCRLTHVYQDGAAPYFTVLAPARRGSEVSQWQEIKSVATRAVLDAGGTVTHHHAVGRDHREGYREQAPPPFHQALAAAKHAVDPAGVCNPGVLGLGA